MTTGDIEDTYELTDAQKMELDRRLSDYEKGIGKTYTWEETVAIARQSIKKTDSSNES